MRATSGYQRRGARSHVQAKVRRSFEREVLLIASPPTPGMLPSSECLTIHPYDDARFALPQPLHSPYCSQLVSISTHYSSIDVYTYTWDIRLPPLALLASITARGRGSLSRCSLGFALVH